MASLLQHMLDTQKFLGSDFEAVHRWIDGTFRTFGPDHRKARHHREGAIQAGLLYGHDAEFAALLHILRDCRHIPTEKDYKDGTVDAFGLKKNWATAAYVRYNDADFEELVRQLLKPSALVLWPFLDWNDAKSLLTATSTLSEDQIDALEPAWQTAFERLHAGPEPVPLLSPFQEATELPDIDLEVSRYLFEVLDQAVQEEQRSTAFVGYIDLSALTNPFVYLDYELLEDLKPELSGSSEIEIAQFSLPKSVQTPITAVGDPTQRTVTLVSRQKTMTVSNVRLRATPQGTEVSYLISANAAGVVVTETGGRFFLRNGIHRAYLMAQLGIKHIPCILIRDRNMPPFFTSPYPTLSPPVMLRDRPPLLVDFLRPELCLQAPIRRSQRLIRITADEMSIPVD